MRQRIMIDKETPFQGALDFSYMQDAPAGKFGHVYVKEGHFYFENGRQVRFFGFNFPARANMPDHKTAEILSARLASMGVNVVRVHAVDAASGEKGWSTNPKYSILDDKEGSGRLNERGLERLDYWLYQLKIHGIYLHIDLLVGRRFLAAQNLDYPMDLPMSKSSSHFNERLIQLQEEYAIRYLTHVNQYTGLTLAEDPAVMTVQICNEDSVFFDSKTAREHPAVAAYKKELQRRFNAFLLAKYDTRKNLKKAWSYWENGRYITGLEEDEDPQKGNVRCPEIGNYCQNVNDSFYKELQESRLETTGRYADFTQFEMELNQNYYQRMINLLRSIPVKAPIATGCLLAGAADIYSHLSAEVMENNAYFNHPLGSNLDFEGILVPDLRDYVSTDPMTQTFPEMEHRSNITVQASIAAVEKRPMILSEWNEYGLQLFHSPAYLMTTAYACLNDWDGLIIYCYHTDDHLRPEAADKILDVMDCYSDPSLMLQFGMLAKVFRNGLINASPVTAHLVYRHEDLLRLPYTYRMPTAYFPLVMRFRSVFLEPGEQYEGNAQVAVSAGFVAGGDYTKAQHAILYRHSDDLDAFAQRQIPKNSSGEIFYTAYRKNAIIVNCKDSRYHGEAYLNDQFLCIEDIDKLTEGNDYSLFAELVNMALKKWGILPKTTGLGESGEIISQTGELFFNPHKGYFRVNTPHFQSYAGRNSGKIVLSEQICIKGTNRSLLVSSLSLDGHPLERSTHYLLLIIGESGLDQTTYHPVDFRITEVRRKGNRFVEILDGTVEIRTLNKCVVYSLTPNGQRQKIPIKQTIHTEKENSHEICFSVPSPLLEILIL